MNTSGGGGGGGVTDGAVVKNRDVVTDGACVADSWYIGECSWVCEEVADCSLVATTSCIPGGALAVDEEEMVDASGWILGVKRECGADITVWGEEERVFARFLGTSLFFRPLPDGMPLIANNVIFGCDAEDTYQSKNC